MGIFKIVVRLIIGSWLALVFWAPIQTMAAPPVYPLKLSPNRRYLVDQRNVPFLIAGDSPQALMPTLSETEADRYFANRQAHGFNAAGWINVVSAPPCYPATHKDASTYDNIRPFRGFVAGGEDYAHYDLTEPNEAYFARLDHMIQLAAKHGIAVFLDPMETINWLPTLRNNGPAACTAYGKYLGGRYKGFPNIVWLHGNDFASWKNNSGDRGLVQAVAKGIKSADAGHLQTVELMLDPSSQDPTWRPIISINLAYTYAATYVQMLECYNQAPDMPVFLGEAHYDLEQVGSPTDYGTPAVLRRQAYWTMLCGGTGQFYGNAYTWTFKPGWEKNLDTPGACAVHPLEELLRRPAVVRPGARSIPCGRHGWIGEEGRCIDPREPERLPHRGQDRRRRFRDCLYADAADDHREHGGFERARHREMVRSYQRNVHSHHRVTLDECGSAAVHAAWEEPRWRLGAAARCFGRQRRRPCHARVRRTLIRIQERSHEEPTSPGKCHLPTRGIEAFRCDCSWRGVHICQRRTQHRICPAANRIEPAGRFHRRSTPCWLPERSRQPDRRP